MIKEILERHGNGTLEMGIPNPTLEVVCQLLSKAAAHITPNVQKRSFKNTGLTVAVDGSEDDQLSPNLKKLLRDHGLDLVVRLEDEARFINTQPITTTPTIAKIFQVLCGNAEKAKEEEFCPEPSKSAPHAKKRDLR